MSQVYSQTLLGDCRVNDPKCCSIYFGPNCVDALSNFDLLNFQNLNFIGEIPSTAQTTAIIPCITICLYLV